MTSIILFLLVRDGKSEAAFARYTAAMRAMPSFEVQIVSKDKSGRDWTADLVIDGKSRMLYDATTPAGKYVLSITPTLYRDVDYRSRIYDEYPSPGPVKRYASRISRIPNSIPYWLLASNLHELLAPGSSAVYAGTKNVAGFSCDVIHSTIRTAEASGFMDFSIAKSGLVYRYVLSVDTPDGHIDQTSDFKNYKKFVSIDPSRFENRIPDRFMPYALPDRDIPIRIGKRPRFSGWMDSTSRRNWAPPVGRPFLFLLAGRDSMPSKRAIDAVNQWKGDLRRKGVLIVVASDAASASDANGLLYDPARHSLDALDVPSTPMMFLLDSHGTLRNSWMGFDPNRENELRNEILRAVADLKRR